jgi:hypothetical protein
MFFVVVYDLLTICCIVGLDDKTMNSVGERICGALRTKRICVPVIVKEHLGL